jgi:uncharacterized protein YecA (UPF0149 family)
LDTRTGDIHYNSELQKALEDAVGDEKRIKELQDLKENIIPMQLPPTKEQMAKIPPRVGRNDSCPCGSGKKFKKCHLNQTTKGE